jgi:hypothetical protein
LDDGIDRAEPGPLCTRYMNGSRRGVFSFAIAGRRVLLAAACLLRNGLPRSGLPYTYTTRSDAHHSNDCDHGSSKTPKSFASRSVAARSDAKSRVCARSQRPACTHMDTLCPTARAKQARQLRTGCGLQRATDRQVFRQGPHRSGFEPLRFGPPCCRLSRLHRSAGFPCRLVQHWHSILGNAKRHLVELLYSQYWYVHRLAMDCRRTILVKTTAVANDRLIRLFFDVCGDVESVRFLNAAASTVGPEESDWPFATACHVCFKRPESAAMAVRFKCLPHTDPPSSSRDRRK